MSLSRVSFVVVEVMRFMFTFQKLLKQLALKKERYKTRNASMTDNLTYEMHFSKYDF